jgi:hypothetical protein
MPARTRIEPSQRRKGLLHDQVGYTPKIDVVEQTDLGVPVVVQVEIGGGNGRRTFDVHSVTAIRDLNRVELQVIAPGRFPCRR